MHWTRGYVTDVGYTAHFYREMAPAHLAFAALVSGRSPGGAFAPRRVVELGCGQGFGLALLAAANPHIAFEGYDFNPAHVAHASRLIANAELSNIEVIEASFQEQAAAGQREPADIVSLHGIWSWVSADARDAILSIMRQRLRPEGLVYISYNCQPGWASILPMRQFMLDTRQRNPGHSDTQVGLALDQLTQLRNGGAAYFTANPPAAAHLDHLLKQDKIYLAHEYFGAGWEIMPFATVAAMLDEAKLGYVGSATIAENLDQYAVPSALHEMVASAHDVGLRETIRDYAANKRFRRDIFSRGLTPLTKAEHRELLERVRFVGVRPREDFKFTFQGPLGELTGKEELYKPVADLVAQKPATVEELRALPAFRNESLGTLLDCLALLIHSHQVFALTPGVPTDPAPSQRFNRWITERLKIGRVYHSIASPVLGSGLPVDDFDLLALSAVFDGCHEDLSSITRHALNIFKLLERRPQREGTALTDDEEATRFLENQIQPIIENKFPLWRKLGII
ncbi:MAG: class I SAM-dependent methyltransferase [Chelatococcus sp.]|uniref:class I SAM-dependent methyltransferase n=1 Tax=Chelatococcus sp. TaxID=1953771 RepID=UPI0025C4A406|nr:class I SAM-dependent methyltransferase [Chelatococcus sp.]MBX3540260.1 class I SAM-dependent methyltransferase [Chelatococcus sp.]